MPVMHTPPPPRQRQVEPAAGGQNGEDPFAGPSGAAPLTNGTPVLSGRKRTGKEAGFSEDSPLHPLRRSLIAAEAQSSSLERKLLAATTSREESDRVIAEQAERIERMLKERRDLVRAKEQAERREQEKEDEMGEMRNSHALALQEAARSRSRTDGEVEALRSEHARLSAAHVTAVTEHQSLSSALHARIDALERERDDLKPYRAQAHELGAQVDQLMRELLEAREKRAAGTGTPRGPSAAAPDTPSDDLRKELRRQAGQLSTLQGEYRKLQTECVELRKRRDNVEMVRNELKNVERKSKDRIRNLTEELDRARREMDSITQAFAPLPDVSDPTTSGDIASLQHRVSELASAHANCASSITAHKNQISDLLANLEQVSGQSEGELVRLKRELEEAQREWRWASEGRKTAEAKLELAKQEIDRLRLKASAANNAGSGVGSADTADLEIQIAQLEDTLEVYRQTIEKFESDSRDAQAKVILDLDLVKRGDLDEALRKARSLEDIIGDLKDHIAALELQNVDLDKEVGDLMIRVGSGEYNTRTWRCLELKGGPAEKDRVIRSETLDRLKRENEALLKQVKEMEGKVGSAAISTAPGDASGMVPRETYDRLLKESEEANAANAKRLQRLREIFGQKSREFLDSVYSLLGWRIRFDPDKGDVALTSMYAPKGKMGLTLRFTSSEGHFGTMLMTGGMARGLEDVRKYWVESRQSVPGFLSQVTLEMFEKTTIGRAPGFVAADEAEE